MNKWLSLISFSLLCSLTLWGQEQREITVDVNNVKGTHDRFYKECIGAGRANEGLRADWQEQLKIVKDECGFKYIRFHGIFHDDMGVYIEGKDGVAIYNWQYVDKLYDFILSIDMKPFVELSFMPSDLAVGDETVFWWNGNVTMYKSKEKYQAFIHAFVQHLTERYGMDEVKDWYFEVWNEPNHSSFFDGTKEDYFEMYAAAVLEIKKVSSDYGVGGPATAGSAWVEDLIHYCVSEDVPLDFISTHAYNVAGFLDEFGDKQLKMRSDSLLVAAKVKQSYQSIKESELTALELHYTEWSSSYSPVDPVHDTYQNAAIVLNILKNSVGYATSMSYWVFTDVFEEVWVPATPFHGGFGLLNLQGIKKPTFFVYKYLNQLGSIELANNDKQSWACKEGNDIQLLLYDMSYPKQGDESNKEYFTQKHPSSITSEVKITVKGMADGNYQLVMYKTGYLFNDAFSHYYDLGMPSQLNKEQVTFLNSVTADHPVINKVVNVKDGVFTTSCTTRQNDVVLVKLNALK